MTPVTPSSVCDMQGESYRKKPVVIKATQYTAAVRDAYLFDKQPLPAGVRIAASNTHPGRREVYRADAYIQTLEGCMEVSLDDWVITGVKGEHYPCKPDIFAATYESAALAERTQQEALTPAQAGEAFVRSLGLGLWPDHRHCYEMGYSDALAARPTSAANSTAPMQPSDQSCEQHAHGWSTPPVEGADLRALVRAHCEDLERCAEMLAKQPGFLATAAEISVAAAELMTALAAPTQAPMQPSEAVPQAEPVCANCGFNKGEHFGKASYCTNEGRSRSKWLATQAPSAAPTQAAGGEAVINGKPASARSLLDALIDIYDDAQNNAPEHRCYVESAWSDVLKESRAFLAAAPAAAVEPKPPINWERVEAAERLDNK